MPAGAEEVGVGVGRAGIAKRLSQGPDLPAERRQPALADAMHGSCDIIIEEMGKPGHPEAGGVEQINIGDLATVGGQKPIILPSGEERKFLQDGDEVFLRARADREGFASIGFGECRGLITPATLVE
jgi:hypothetical protein